MEPSHAIMHTMMAVNARMMIPLCSHVFNALTIMVMMIAMTAMHMMAVARMFALHAKCHAFGMNGMMMTASSSPMTEYIEIGFIHVLPVKLTSPSYVIVHAHITAASTANTMMAMMHADDDRNLYSAFIHEIFLF